MTLVRTYLDHNASSPLRPEARAAMISALDIAGNPSSIHTEGRAARALIEQARERVAALVGAMPQNVVFTSGGTEAANTVIAGGFDTVAVAGIEHDCVRQAARASGAMIEEIAVTADGLIVPQALERSLHRCMGRTLVCIQAANNETGVLQDVAELSMITAGAILLSDAVQAAGKIVIDMTKPGADVLVLSAHKIGGPKGVGAIVARDGSPIGHLLRGGGQERGRRAGTENVAGIVGFGVASELALRDLAEMRRLERLRDRLIDGVRCLTPDATVVGEAVPRLANTALIASRDAKAETLIMALDLEGVAASAGAACSSGKVGKSATLEAMGLPAALRDTAIRLSLGWSTTEQDIERFLAAWARVSGRLEKRRVA